MQRRDFILTSTLAASQLVVPWAHAGPGAQQTDGDTLQCALIGAGSQGRLLLNAARQVPEIRFRAVCDIWQYSRDYSQKYLARYGQQITTYADYREMLDKEPSLDAVLIASPDFVHAAQTIDCLERGLNVYCEPMLAHTLEAARRVVQTAGRTDTLLQVGYHRRSNPRYLHVYDKLLRDAQLPGILTAVQTQWAQEADVLRGWPRRFTIPAAELRQYGYADMQEFRNWMWFPKYSGGPFCCNVSHQLDACNWLLNDRPLSVLASGGNSFYAERPHFDTVMSVLEYPGTPDKGLVRASCNMLTTTSAGGMRLYERLLGTQGSIQLSENPHWTMIGREPNADDWDQWVRREYLVKPEMESAYEADENAVEVQVSGELELYTLPELQTNARFAPHLANFCAAIRGSVALACPAEAAWPAHVTAFKTLEAAEAHKRLALTGNDYLM